MILEFLMAFSISETTYSQQQQGCEGGQTGGQFSAFVVSACNNCHEPMARLRTASAAKSVRFMCFHLLSFLFKILKRFTARALIRRKQFEFQRPGGSGLLRQFISHPITHRPANHRTDERAAEPADQQAQRKRRALQINAGREQKCKHHRGQ